MSHTGPWACQAHQAPAPSRILHGSDTARQAIKSLALAPFLNGSQPYSRSAELQRLRTGSPGAPGANDPRVVRRHTSETGDTCLLTGPGWTATYHRNLKASASVQGEVAVTATTQDLAARVLADLVSNYGEEQDESRTSVPMGFWHLAEHGSPQRVSRNIQVPRWSAIRSNYAHGAREGIDELAELTPFAAVGTIILMYGPPGTGKTTALRSLARSWQEWCSFEYILDPEKLFASPGYLLNTALPLKDGQSRWSALILEDCDELLGSDAKRTAGQSLARLLNLSDGILGQGGRTLLLITTNEDIHRLHPAITRPGRCLAQIEVGLLDPEEVRRWHNGAAADLSAGPTTLAQLYAHTTKPTRLLPAAPRNDLSGVYL